MAGDRRTLSKRICSLQRLAITSGGLLVPRQHRPPHLSDEVKAVEGTDVTVGALWHLYGRTSEEETTIKAG